ncbi:MAG: acyl-CoA dehydrogenase family protein [Chloroflexi bacterium]|nr:acyl-CoA dehydrogenase family protein [Chloroflexota bacterium]
MATVSDAPSSSDRARAEERALILETTRHFVDNEVIPVASRYEHADEYPFELVEKMKALGLFGITIPQEYGGSGLDFTTYAMIVEEVTRGWMSLSGIFNSHLLIAYMIDTFGTPEQKQRYLPKMASGEWRAAVAITEPDAGSDVQAIRTRARRDGDDYVITGTKMFITNAREARFIATVVKTDPAAQPRYRGMSIILVDKGLPGFSVGRQLKKLGYKGLETCEVVYDGVRVPASQVLGGVEGQGFSHIMSALEVGRINVAARGLGIARAAFEAAIKYAQLREAFGKKIAEHQAIQLKLADMATKIEAARLLIRAAAEKKDRGERCDLEAGMAKLFATEVGQECALEAMRIHGGIGYTQELPVERYYRDAPLLLIGEGTNEIQRLVIARTLLKRYAVD